MIKNNKRLMLRGWHKMGLKDRFLQKRVVWGLEGEYWAIGITLFHWGKMWDADRFMFDAFRGGSKDCETSTTSGIAISFQEGWSSFIL